VLGHTCATGLAGDGGSNGEVDLATIFRDHGQHFAARHHLNPQQRRAISDIARCRTAALGGHLHQCLDCGFSRPLYNSCRNRHCPKCQALAQARWIAGRAERLLPIGAFHIVFTAPDSLRALALDDPEMVYAILMRAAAHALSSLAADPRFFGAKIALTTVLHTWTRDLRHHPHVHCIVPAGALDVEGERWVPARKKFFLPLAPLSARFRTLVCEDLARLAKHRKLHSRFPHDVLARRIRHLRSTHWNIYAKRSFGSPLHILQYLGRYTHRVAISNARVSAIDDSRITFRTRNGKCATLSHEEFLGRFLLHVLPHGFHKIRHFGLLAPCHSKKLLPLAERCIRAQGLDINIEMPTPDLAAADTADQAGGDHLPVDDHSEVDIPAWMRLLQKLTGRDPTRCPACGGRLRLTPLPASGTQARGPPWR
jgi:hypothetical protein